MRPSTGFFSVILALQLCRRVSSHLSSGGPLTHPCARMHPTRLSHMHASAQVSLFGLTSDPCRPFHYYGTPKTECTSAIPPANDESVHWFEKEHEIYANLHRRGRLTIYS